MSYSHVYFQGNITRYMSILLLVLKSSMVFSLELNTHDRTAIILSVTTSSYVCFPSSSVVKNLPVLQETYIPSLDREDPLEDKMTTHSSILPGKSQGQGSLVGYSPWGHKRAGHRRGRYHGATRISHICNPR